MPRRAPEISMLEMSVARSSTSETTVESSVREVQASPGRPENASKAGRKRRQKENDVEQLKDIAKLRGRPRMLAVDALDEVVKSLQPLSDIKKETIEKYKENIESLDRILDVLGDHASQISLNALGDFKALALNPKPFADVLEESAKEYDLRSPDPSESRKQKELLRSKLKTSTSLTRVSSCVTPSGAKPATSIASRAAPKARNEPTPLRNRGK